MQNEYKSIIKIALSFDYKHLVLYTNNGCLWMGSSDLKVKYCEFNTGRSEIPKQITWCLDVEPNNNNNNINTTKNAVIIAYQSLLLIIGINGESNIYSYDPAIFLIQEMDCVRIITHYLHEVIQKIPKSVFNIFAINSQESSSFLFESNKKFMEKSHQSDEYLCLIKNNLDNAVTECINAASYEFDSETQKSLIRVNIKLIFAMLL